MYMKSRILRVLAFVIGICLNSFGVAFVTKAALGTSPISSVPYVLSLALPLTLGQFTFIMNLGFILLQAILLRRDFAPIQYLQIVVNVLFSACIDWSMALLFWLVPASIAARLISLCVGCCILALGISIEVAPDVLLVPGEGVVKAIAQVTRFRFGSVKVVFDVSLMAMAAMLSFFFFRGLQGIGWGTVISARLVGRIVNVLNRRLPLIPRIRALKTASPAAER